MNTYSAKRQDIGGDQSRATLATSGDAGGFQVRQANKCVGELRRRALGGRVTMIRMVQRSTGNKGTFACKRDRFPPAWIALVAALILTAGLVVVGSGQTATTTEVLSSVNPSTYGEDVTFTVTVYEGEDPLQNPSGTVSLYDNDNFVESKDLPDTSASVDFTLCFLSVGEHTIRAEYSGASGAGYDYESSTGSLDQRVDTIATTLFITGPSSAYLDEPYLVTGTIEPVDESTDCGGTITPTGTVSVDDGHGGTCAANLESDGSWQCSLTSSSSSVTQLTATYEGDAMFAGSTDAENITLTERPKEDTSINLVSDNNPSTYGELVTFTATVSPAPSDGTVSFFDDDTQLATSAVDPANGEAVFSTSALAVGTHSMTAEYSGNEDYEGSTSNTVSQVVDPIGTTTTLASDKSTAAYHEPVTFTATVTETNGGDPVTTGTMTFKDGTTEIGTGAVGDSGEAFLTTSDLSIGEHSVTAAYTSDGPYDTSTSSPISVTVTKRATETRIEGSDTPLVVGDTATFTVIVTDVSPGTPSAPSGEVDISVSPGDEGTLSASTVTLDGDGRATFTYTPDSAATTPHMFTATYTGDTTHYASDETDPTTERTFSQSILERAVDVQLICSPVDAYINQPVECTVILSDDTTAGTAIVPDEAYLTLSDDRYSGPTRFSTVSWSTVGNDRVGTFTWTPAAWDTDADQGVPLVAQSQATATITATFAGSPQHADAETFQPLTVRLRPTTMSIDGPAEALLVYEKGDFTIEVEDTAGVGTTSAPSGTITITPSLSPTADSVIYNKSGPSLTDPTSTWTFDYYRKSLENDGAYDILQVEYTANDGVHADTGIGYGQAIIRRPTVTTVSDCSCNQDGVQCNVTVEDDPDNSSPVTGIPAPAGDFYAWVDTDEDGVLEEVDVGNAPSATVQIDSNLIMTNVTIQYKPSDNIYQKSTGSENVDRSDCMPSPNPTPGDATSCTAGCGEGGVDVYAIIDGLKAGCLAADALALVMDAGMLLVDPIPDPIIGAGFLVITGSTIPTSDILASIVGWTKVALSTYSLIACTDSDSDGIPDVVELGTTGTDPYNRNTDGDAMGDMDEIGYCAGYYGGSRRPDPNTPDSDGDGLLDGYEMEPFNTDVCVADTDCDTLPDGIEVACRTEPTADNGFDVDSFSALGYSGYSFPFADPRDHPNPREGDTDGDGLRDDIEFGPGKLASDINDTTYSPYVNQPDSDGDGILDGHESTNGDAVWDYTQIGSTGTTGSGETHLCLADTDGDGLLDGEEEALFGRGPIEVHSPLGTTTTAALDDDSDDDGLSDYEETNITQTDPLNWDTDGDGIGDADELIATGGTWPIRTFSQESDPLDPDTDDDGLSDYVEYGNDGVGTGLGTLYARADGPAGDPDTICPYVNDDDSDDDGLQDGAESWNGDATITTGTIGNTDTQADISPSGETDFCDPDTDGDGLTDGEEVALLGGLPIDGTNGFTPVTPEGVSTVFGEDGPALDPTVPPLDDDCDNDGLSDYEEINITGTDPLDADTDNDTLSDANELIATGGTWPKRTFQQVSDPLDPDTDDDGIQDQNEYPGSGLGTSRGLGGVDDLHCPYVNDDDSDDDGLQDGVEDANHDGTWGVAGSGITVGNWDSQASKTVEYWECDLCNPDTDGDGLLDGEEVQLIGGGPILGRPADWPANQPYPGFDTLIPEAVSTDLPEGTNSVPAGFTHPMPIPGTNDVMIAPYTFAPVAGGSLIETIPALDSDSDNDGLSDYEEVNITGTDPLDQDSDNDTLMDSDELIATGGTWPRRTFDQESDPLSVNTDGDHLFDPQEYAGSGLSAAAGGAPAGSRDTECPFVNDADSDDDGVQDGARITRSITANGVVYAWEHYEDFIDLPAAEVAWPGTVRTVVTEASGEQQDDDTCNVCDPDSDGDGLLDGEEVALGTDPSNWDTDGDGRNDWHEVTGGGPIPTDPFDPDTDDDGLLDSAEVFGSNPTNPVNCDTDADGLCDGGNRTPYMLSGHPTVVINPRCLTGIGGHPNPEGIGEDEDGEGDWDSNVETDPNNPDTDGDAVGDGFEVLGFSVNRQSSIPTHDSFGRPILVVYPSTGCMDPLNPDTDGDGLLDGEEDLNHDGHFDFHTGDFDLINYTDWDFNRLIETNPCDPDTDGDGLDDYEERHGTRKWSGRAFYPTNPLDHDTDNDWLLDAEEVDWECVALYMVLPEGEGEWSYDAGAIAGSTMIDGTSYYIRYVEYLDPTNRDSDADGFIDGLERDPCNSHPIPIIRPIAALPLDSDGDGFADEDELAAGTDPFDPDSYPLAFSADLDLDGRENDRLWLTDADGDGIVDVAVIDFDSDGIIDARVQIVASRDAYVGDFDDDGEENDCRYVVSYAFADQRIVLYKWITAVIYDMGCDLEIDRVEVTRQ